MDIPSTSVLVLIRYRLVGVVNTLKSLQRDSLLKIVLVSTLGAVFWLGLFMLFMHGFKFVNDTAGLFRPFLVHHILSLFFLSLTFMLVFSNAVISFSNLFKSTETAFLFSLPVRHDTIFLYKLVESLLFSSWAVFVLGLPLMVAYGIQTQAPWFFYPLVFVFLVPFVCIPAALGSLLGLLLTAIIPRHRVKILWLGAIGFFAIAFYIGMTVFHSEFTGTPSSFEMQGGIKRVTDHLRFTQHPMTPNYWITEGLLAVCEGRPNSAAAGGIFFGALMSSSLFLLALGWFLSGSLYEGTYSLASGGDSIKRLATEGRIERICAPLLKRHPEVMILLLKDIKSFLRDPAQWSQVLIFFGILTLYIGNLRNFAYPLDQPFYQNLISFLNLGATCMTLATMTSRFIFPMISLEGRRFWILGLAPLERRNVMMSKFYFSLFGSLLLTLSLALLSNYILRSTRFVLGIQLMTGVLISVGLSGLSVGMGAIFPSFQESSPSKIVSGFGGTLTLILAMILVIFTIMGEGLVCQRFIVLHLPEDVMSAEPTPAFPVVMVLGAVAGLNLFAAFVPMKLGIRALERVEF